MPRLTGAEILWDCLVREGVTDVFGYPGGAILPAYDAMLKYPIRHVLVRHEQGATHMADGYARASGKVGVAVATSGPGATNMVTGIATAMMDSSPIVCITGQVGSRLIGSDAFQETDITGITLPVTKHNYLVTRADEIAPTVREAFLVAKSGRPGPVLIDMTKDAQQSSCEFDWDAAAPSPCDRPHSPVAGRSQHAPGARAHPVGPPAARARRPRPDAVERHGGVPRVRRQDRRAGGGHAARHRLSAGVAPAEPRHDGHARRSVGQHRDSGSRSPDRARHALRRPRDRQSEDLRAERPQDSRRHRPGRDRQERPGRRRHRGRRPRRAARLDSRPLEPLDLGDWTAASTRSRATRPSATFRSCRTMAICTRRT